MHGMNCGKTGQNLPRFNRDSERETQSNRGSNWGLVSRATKYASRNTASKLHFERLKQFCTALNGKAAIDENHA